MSNYVPLRDRDDLPDEVRQILSVRRHVANPWTEEDALVIARWRGYEPTEPWPGTVGLAWRGVCVLGHQCGPTLSNVLQGRPPCRRNGHIKEEPGVRRSPKGPSAQERRAKTAEKVLHIAAERGHVIHAIDTRATAGGVIGTVRKTFLTVEYAGCGHTSGELAIPADEYIAEKGSGCSTCNPKKVIPGLNDLATVRPDLAAQLADPSQANSIAISTGKKVTWRCPDCHCEWDASVGNRHHRDSGCPKCNYGGGYLRELQGTLYVVRGISPLTRELLIKIGISNVPHMRLASHARQGLTEVLCRFTWTDGAIAADLERKWVLRIRKRLPKHLKATKADLLDGYREAVIDTDESRLAIHAFLLEAQVTRVETLTEKVFDPEVFLPRVR